MTRDEEIEKKARQVSYNSEEHESFVLGAEWADEHPQEGLVNIDDVCSYLETRIDDSIIQDLRKAMGLKK